MEELLEFIDDTIAEFHTYVKQTYNDKGFLNESRLADFHKIFASLELCRSRTISIEDDPYLLDFAEETLTTPVGAPVLPDVQAEL
jgi:hypothetical protein